MHIFTGVCCSIYLPVFKITQEMWMDFKEIFGRWDVGCSFNVTTPVDSQESWQRFELSSLGD